MESLFSKFRPFSPPPLLQRLQPAADFGPAQPQAWGGGLAQLGIPVLQGLDDVF